MARYVKLLRSIWKDPDFRALTHTAQWCYMMLISQPDISHVGVLSLACRRWASHSTDMDADSMRAALDELEAAGLVVIDSDSEELLVRTYIKYDELGQSVNGRKALVQAHAEVLSSHLASVVAAAIPPPSEGGPEGGPGGANRGGGSLQEPAASSLSHEPAASSRGPAEAPTIDTGHHDHLPAAAAAAIDILIGHKLGTEPVRTHSRYRAKLAGVLPVEHGPALRQYLYEHPAADPVELARNVLGLTELDVFRARTAAG